MKQYDHVKNFTFDGKRYKLRCNSEKDVIIKMANKIRDLEEGKVVISNTMTVRAWSVKAVEIYRTNQGDIMREKYMQSMRHCIFEPIGEWSLPDAQLHFSESCRKQADSRESLREYHEAGRLHKRPASNNRAGEKAPD